MCYILRWHHTLCLPPAKNTNSSNLVRNSPTSLCTVSRETVRRLMVDFHIAGHIYYTLSELPSRVLRSAARLIGRVSKFDHISAYIRDVLHWLPLRQRTEFSRLVLPNRSGPCLPY